MIKHVIFDFDGTLADTEDQVYEFLNDILRDNGLSVVPEDQREEYKMMGAKQILKNPRY